MLVKIVSNIFFGLNRLRVPIKRVASPLHSLLSLRNMKSSTNLVKFADDAGVAGLAGAASPFAVTLVFLWIIYHVSTNEGDPLAFAKLALMACGIAIGLAFKLRSDYRLISRQMFAIGIASMITVVGFGMLAFALPGFRSMTPGVGSFDSLLLINMGAIFMAALGPGLAAPLTIKVGRNMARAF